MHMFVASHVRYWIDIAFTLRQCWPKLVWLLATFTYYQTQVHFLNYLPVDWLQVAYFVKCTEFHRSAIKHHFIFASLLAVLQIDISSKCLQIMTTYPQVSDRPLPRPVRTPESCKSYKPPAVCHICTTSHNDCKHSRCCGSTRNFTGK